MNTEVLYLGLGTDTNMSLSLARWKKNEPRSLFMKQHGETDGEISNILENINLTQLKEFCNILAYKWSLDKSVFPHVDSEKQDLGLQEA
jgi:hypothetical protein